MNESVTILLPTRGRAEQAKSRIMAMLAEFLPLAIDLAVVVAAEATDTATIAAFEEVARIRPSSQISILEREPGKTAVYGWNQAYAFARERGGWMVLGADDVEWLPSWLAISLAAAERGGAQVVGLTDGHDTQRLYGPHYMARVEFLETHLGGVMAVPHYRSWSFDYEIGERASRLGLYANTPQPVIEHHHPVWGLAERDTTYDMAWPSHETDWQLRQQRHAADYPTDYAPATLEAKVRQIGANKMLAAPEVKTAVSAAAARLAAENGLDLSAITGTGQNGQITKRDVEAALNG